MTGPFLGAVLAGGASRRMGRPKATIDVEGRAMGAHVVQALRSAGAREVLVVGGDEAWGGLLGAAVVPDRWPGEGPLAALATAVAQGEGSELVVVAACDQPDLEPDLVGRLVDTLAATDDALSAVPATGGGAGRPQPFPSAWRAGAAPLLVALVDHGARRADAALDLAPPVTVHVAPSALADIDTPDDLARRLHRRPPTSEAPRGRT